MSWANLKYDFGWTKLSQQAEKIFTLIFFLIKSDKMLLI